MTEQEKLIFEANEENFQEAVIEKSKQVPVLVDFWAQWCAPCQVLSPVLEEIVQKYRNKLALAKVDVEVSPALAAQFGIQGIPAVKIFYGGKVVKEFVGALPREEVEKLVKEILPDERASDMKQANRFLSGGRWEEAAKIYQEVIKKDPDHSEAHLGLGIIAFHQARWEDAEEHLSRVEKGTPGSETIPAMRGRIYFEKLSAPDLNEVTRKMRENTKDPQALFTLSIAYAKGGEYERALETLLQLLEVDREFADGEARAVYLKILEIVGRGSELGQKYSRKFSMVLFS